MSEENVEVVRRLHDAAARRDSAAVLALYDADVEVDITRSQMRHLTGAQRVFHGHDGLRAFWHLLSEPWESVEYGVDELIEGGEDVVAITTIRGRGRASGIDLKRTSYMVWTLTNGRVVRLAIFSSRTEALEAAGVPE